MEAKASIRAGLSWAEFCDSTPYQTRIQIDAWLENRKLERNLTMTAAYMTARLSLTQAKHFPSLKDFLPDDEKRKVEQTSEDFTAQFVHWARQTDSRKADG